MSHLSIKRLLQNPMGEPAPPGSAGDIVAVTDGITTVYLTPAEYADATETELRYRLAQTPLRPSPSVTQREPLDPARAT